MRRAARLLCSKIDLDGRPSAYYPRFRPRRLVMPVDPDKVHSSTRARNPLFVRYMQQRRLQRISARRGSIRLAEVPSERSVGDVFRYMLEVCEQHQLFRATACFSAPPLAPLEALVAEARTMLEAGKRAETTPNAEAVCDSVATPNEHLNSTEANGGSSAPSMGITAAAARAAEVKESDPETALRARAVDGMWSLLDRTPLNSPVHGVLALRGKAIVEGTLAIAAQEAFPRLRSKHLQQLLHESCGLLPASRVAVRMGFAQHAGVEGEIGMWRELNVLTQRLQIARTMAAAHRERLEKGVTQQRRWYWRGVLKAATGRLTMFPVHAEDLQPRMEWIRDSMYAFVGFLGMVERSGEAGVDVGTFVLKLFGAQLGRFVYRRALLEEGERLSEALAAAAQTDGAVETVYHKRGAGRERQRQQHRGRRECVAYDLAEQMRFLRTRTADEFDMLAGETHPLNDRADLRREQHASSGGTHAVQSLKDDIFDDYRSARHADAAPSVIVHSLETQNALKEAQLILRYAPDVPTALRDAPIDVDQVVRRTVEVHETNSYASLRYDQQYRQVEYTVCRLFCGTHCIGEGKGDSLMAAIQQAALHMTTNYYVRKPGTVVAETNGRGNAAATATTAKEDDVEDGGSNGAEWAAALDTESKDSASAGKVRLRESRTEEEVAL